MSDRIRRLNERGIEVFGMHIHELSQGNKLDTPIHILTDDRYSEAIEYELNVEQRDFDTRYEMGGYLVEVLSEVNIQKLLGEQGIWSWLALYWFDQLCPAAASGSRKPSKSYNYILSTNYNHRPRHAVYMTWLLVERYGEDSLFMLSKKLHERGELIEQLTARQYLIGCPGVISAASTLYFDPKKSTFKRGSTSQKRKGNMRRFISYLQQLDLTYDLGTISGDSLVGMLPGEYSSFIEG